MLPYNLSMTVANQTLKPISTTIKGTLPKWVKGSLYRNGGGIYKVGNTTLKHLFDGMAVVHKYTIQDGHVWYQNRAVDSKTWLASVKANRLVIGQVGTAATPDPCHNVFQRLLSYFKFEPDLLDNTLVNIVKHGDKLITMTEGPIVNLVDPETLNTTSRSNLSNAVAVHIATAHPHFGFDGTMYNLGISFNYTKAFSIVAIPPLETDADDPFKEARIVSSIPSRWKMNICYNHSFGMSENYFVILEQPVCVNIAKTMYIMITNQPGVAALKSYDREEAIFHLIKRSDGSRVSVKFTTDYFFTFHFVNCYEEDNHLVIDLIGYNNSKIWSQLQATEEILIQQEDAGIFQRYVLPLNPKGAPGTNLVTLKNTAAKAVRRSADNIHCFPDNVVQGSVAMELPRVNYDYNAKKYQYAYGIASASKIGQLIKLDLLRKSVLTWNPSATDLLPGEPVFLPHPEARAEDDGVILSPVISDNPNKGSYLLVLDAKSFQEMARAEIPAGVIVPNTFHGTFTSDLKP